MVAKAPMDGGKGVPPKKIRMTVAELIARLDLGKKSKENRQHILEVNDYYLELQRVDRNRLDPKELDALHQRIKDAGVFLREAYELKKK